MAILPLSVARVSNVLRSNVALSSINNTESQLLDTENQLSTGKRLNSPSDDPASAAIAQQLHKTLEARKAYSTNLSTAQSQLGQVDSSLGDLTDLLTQAKSIASANVGADATPDARKSAAAVVQSIYTQALSIANTQLNGTYLFGGDKGTTKPFIEANGGVQFVGSTTLLNNQYDANSLLSFQADGGAVFGSPSTRIQGGADLSPTLNAATRLTDVRGASTLGVRLGTIQVSDGATTKTVDLSNADSIGDVINAINTAGVGAVSASIAANGVSLQLSAGATDNISVSDVSGGTTASDLGIANVGAGVGASLTGTTLHPVVTPLTNLSTLRGGAGIDPAGFTITNGSQTATITLGGATTVEDLLNKINGSNTGVRAQIDPNGTGIDILNITQGAALTISENGGTTATDLGVRSFGPTSPLTQLNDGKGVSSVAGNDFQISDSNGASLQVDVTGLNTVQDVIDAINTAATTASAGVTASFSTTSNGIVLTDTAGGTRTIAITSVNNSTAATDLGLTAAASGGKIVGTDVNAVTADGIFTNLAKLRDSLETNDTAGITSATEGLTADSTRVVNIRGLAGAQVRGFQSRQTQLDEQNTATQSLLSSLEDTDFTATIAKFQTLQTTLQASLTVAQKTLSLSLLDFIA